MAGSGAWEACLGRRSVWAGDGAERGRGCGVPETRARGVSGDASDRGTSMFAREGTRRGGVGGRARVGRTDEGREGRSWGPRARKDGDDDQAPDVTAGTAVGVGDDDALRCGRGHGIVWRARRRRRRAGGRERRPGGVELPPTRGTGEPVVPNLREAPWEHVLEEPREERRRGERAARQLPGAAITVPKRHAALVELLEATVGDRDAEDVAAEVLEHLLPGARRLHVDDPVAGPAVGAT